jgi:hypothetical protein
MHFDLDLLLLISSICYGMQDLEVSILPVCNQSEVFDAVGGALQVPRTIERGGTGIQGATGMKEEDPVE